MHCEAGELEGRCDKVLDAVKNTSNADKAISLALAVYPSGRHLIAEAKAFATNGKLTLQMAAQ